MKHFQFVIAALIIVLGLAAFQNASAATYTVTNTNDSGAGSLRQAILDANVNNEDDTIAFDSSVFSTPQTIVLTTGELSIKPDNSSFVTKSLTINGKGANLLTIDGNNQNRVFAIYRDSVTFINGLKITGGNGVGRTDNFGSSGGAINVSGGYHADGSKDLTLTNSIVSENRSLDGIGGGILAAGDIVIINSLISNNTAPVNGGGISVAYGSKLSLINSTISKNTTNNGGAGIYTIGNNLSLTNCTVAFNSISSGNVFGQGSGIYLEEFGTGSFNLSLKNTIVANNGLSVVDRSDVRGRVYSEGYNIIGNIDPLYISPGSNTTGNQLNVDPQIDPQLNTNGGVIPTHALRGNSTAIDRGDNCVLKTTADGGCLDPSINTDQRGVARPQDGDGDGTATVDIGAYEATKAEVIIAPSAAPDLQATNDSGESSTDNITSNTNLSFNISGLTNGAVVELLRDGVVVASATAAGNTIVLSDTNVTGNGVHLYTSRQIVNNVQSLQSAALPVTVDTNAPTVIVNQASEQADPTKNQPINFSVVFNEPVSGFDAADVSLNGSTANVSSASVTVTGSGTTYNVAVGSVTGDGSVIAAVLSNAAKDLAGNANAASTGTDNSVIFDTTAPAVTINQSATQTDATRNSSINFTVVFSEPVTGFTNTDVSLAGSTANVSSTFISVSGSGTTYNVIVSNINSNGGIVRASVLPQAAVDTAGNQSAASTSADNTVTVDNVSPTVTINQAVGQADPTGTLPVNFAVVFSEAVTDFDVSDISFTGSSINTFGAIINITGSGATYNVAVGNVTSNSGFIRVSIRSGAGLDSLGNSSFASTSTDNTVIVDNVAPTVSINQAIGQSDPASVQPINFTVVFSELITNFDASDISLAGSTANVSAATITVSGSGNVYNVKVGNVTSNGEVRVSIAVGAARDVVGNLSAASTGTDNTVTINVKNTSFNFDSDGKADISVYRPESGTWFLQNSQSGFISVQFGISTDKIVPADYDGDGKTDIAVYRGGIWYLQRTNQGFASVQFGLADDIPVPADFDGDGKADVAVYRPSNGTWYILTGTTGQYSSQQWGESTDKPVVSDYDGDGKADYAVYRPSNGTWYLLRSRDGFAGVQWGVSTDKPVVGDYDGDGKADQAVYRPSVGTWYILRSRDGYVGTQFGEATDLPVPSDYDGDGKTDVAVYRVASGTWYLLKSAEGFVSVQFGLSSDKPTPNAFVP